MKHLDTFVEKSCMIMHISHICHFGQLSEAVIGQRIVHQPLHCMLLCYVICYVKQITDFYKNAETVFVIMLCVIVHGKLSSFSFKWLL